MLTDPYGTNALTNAIIGCAIDVHRVIGPGVYERIYSECMEYELKEVGLEFELGRPAALVYKGATLKSKYYVDIVVANQVAVELKAVADLVDPLSSNLPCPSAPQNPGPSSMTTVQTAR